VARETNGALGDVVEREGAHEVFDILRNELASTDTVLVLEDLHWADEATLDVVRLLGRRMGTQCPGNPHVPRRRVRSCASTSGRAQRDRLMRRSGTCSSSRSASNREPRGLKSAARASSPNIGQPFFVQELLRDTAASRDCRAAVLSGSRGLAKRRRSSTLSRSPQTRVSRAHLQLRTGVPRAPTGVSAEGDDITFRTSSHEEAVVNTDSSRRLAIIAGFSKRSPSHLSAHLCLPRGPRGCARPRRR
jgi:hypothetical protein